MADITFLIDADLGDARKAVDEFAAQSISSVQSIAETVRSVFTFDAVGSAGEFLSGFAEKGVEVRDSLLKLQAQTGLTGSAFDALKQQAEDAFVGGVGGSVAEAVAAVATARQSLGKILPEDQIAQFTIDASAIGRVYDKDVNEVIQKSRTFLQNFNLEGEKGAGLIALAARDGNTAMDDVLDTLDEYSQLWKQTGLSAEEAVGLITTGVQAGARDTDKIADSLKELQIRLKADDVGNALKDITSPVTETIKGLARAAQEGSITVADYAQQSAQAIEEAYASGKISETVRSQLQVAIAGTPAEDLGSDLYARVFGAEIDTADIQKKATEALEDVRKVSGPITVFEQIGKQFELLTTKVSEFAGPVVAGLGDVLGVVGQIGPAITLIIPLLPALSAGFASVWAAVTGPVGLVVAGIAAVGAAFYLLYENVQPVRDFVDRALQFLADAVAAVMPAFSALGDVLLSLGTVAYEWLIAPFEIAWSLLSSLVEAIFGASDAGSGFSDILEGLGAVVAKVVTFFKGVSTALDKVRDAIQGAKAGFLAFVGGVKNAVTDLLSLNFSGFIDKISNVADHASAEMRRVADEAASKRFKSNLFASTIDPVVQGFNADLDILAKKFGAGTAEFQKELDKSLRLRRSQFFSNAAASNIRDAELTKAQEEFEERLKEAIEAAKKNVTRDATRKPGSPVKIPVKVETKDLDITSSIKAITDEARTRLDAANKTLAELSLTGVEDAFKLQLDDIGNRTEDATEKLNTAVAALKIQLGNIKDEADKKTLIKFDADPTDTVEAITVTKEEALKIIDAALREGNDAIAAEAQAAIAKLNKDFAAQRVDIAIRGLQEEAAQELVLLKAKETLATGTTIDAIKERGRLRLEQTRIQLDAEFNEQLRALPAFQQAFSDAVTKAKATTPEAITAIFESLKTQFATTDERAALLFDAMQAQLRAIGIETNATLDEANAKLAADRKALREGTLEWEVQLALREGFAKAFFGVYNDERRKTLVAEIADLQKDSADAWKDYLSGKISSYRDYADTIGEINADIAAKQDELNATTLSGWQQFIAAAGATFEALADQQRSKLDAQLSDLNSQINAQFDKLQAGEKVDFEAIGDSAVKASKIAAAEVGAVWGAMAASGKATLGDFADAAIITTLRTIRTIVEGNIVSIISAAFAVNPLLGALSIPAVVGVLALLSKWESDARARLGQHGFRYGGYTGDGPEWEVAGPAHRGEFYFSREKTREWRPLFDMIQAGQLRPNDLRSVAAGPSREEMYHMAQALHESREARREVQAVRSDIATLQRNVAELTTAIKEREDRLHVTADAAVKVNSTHTFNGPNIVDTVTTYSRDSVSR